MRAQVEEVLDSLVRNPRCNATPCHEVSGVDFTCAAARRPIPATTTLRARCQVASPVLFAALAAHCPILMLVLAALGDGYFWDLTQLPRKKSQCPSGAVRCR
eukprot:439406-Rhodomonas_salina.2